MLDNLSLFRFKVDQDYFAFHRNSFSIFHLPKSLTKSDVDNLVYLAKKEEAKIQTVDKLTLRTLALNLTNNCNFSCKYCFAEGGTYGLPGLSMSRSTAFQAINLLFENVALNHQKRIAIAFFGGEPLLKWDLMKKGVEYFREKTKNWTKSKKSA